jgi:hypothetical protein
MTQLREPSQFVRDVAHRPRGQQGRPVLAQGEMASGILEHVARLSEPYAAGFRIEDGIGQLDLA